MLKFRLEFDIKKIRPFISQQQKILLVGSCFTENIGEKLKRYKFPVLLNPNGILFNPVSVAESIHQYINCIQIGADELFNLHQMWHSWKHHSRFSAVSSSLAIDKINDSTREAHTFLKEAEWMMITLGSAWVYTLSDLAPQGVKGEVAANNHKAPEDWFLKKLLTAANVTDVLSAMINKLQLFNPNLNIIFTISPVRHVREGVIENNRSKAVLIQAVHDLVAAHEQLHYFPAYELVIDDLRDYRYYSEDLVHPNYFATQYVWEKFSASSMSQDTHQLMEDIHSINLAFHHKPFNQSSDQHKKFMDVFYIKTIELQRKYPFLDLSEELNFFHGNK